MVDRWHVFYADGKVLSSYDTKPENLPIDGVIWILEIMESGAQRNIHGSNYYMWTGDSWACGNIESLEKWLRRKPKKLIVLFGLWISDLEYQAIKNSVKEYAK